MQAKKSERNRIQICWKIQCPPGQMNIFQSSKHSAYSISCGHNSGLPQVEFSNLPAIALPPLVTLWPVWLLTVQGSYWEGLLCLVRLVFIALSASHFSRWVYMKGLAGGEPLGKSHLDTALRFKLKRSGE